MTKHATPPGSSSDKFIEMYGPRNTNYNETVRANNKRAARGEPAKAFPKGKVARETWKPTTAKKKNRKAVTAKR